MQPEVDGFSEPELEKATYAKIYNAGFPDLCDSDERPALEADLSKHYIYSQLLENRDPKTCNTILFQFLALNLHNKNIRYVGTLRLYSLYN